MKTEKEIRKHAVAAFELANEALDKILKMTTTSTIRELNEAYIDAAKKQFYADALRWVLE